MSGTRLRTNVMSKQKIGWSVVALAFVLVLMLVRYATLYWLEASCANRGVGRTGFDPGLKRIAASILLAIVFPQKRSDV
jgi:hypothetical protein